MAKYSGLGFQARSSSYPPGLVLDCKTGYEINDSKFVIAKPVNGPLWTWQAIYFVREALQPITPWS